MALFVYADPSHADPDHPQRDHIDRLKANGRYPESYVDEADLYRLVMPDLMAHFFLNPATRRLAARIQPSNLPGGYIGRLFLGRDEFLEEIRASLLGSAHATAITQQAAVTCISGLGGIGKTRAAVEYARRHRADYSALLFATADSPERLHSSLADLCGVLRLDENGNLPPEEPARVAAALGWLAAHPGWLLIVDNVDDEAAARALVDLLGHLAAGHVLITSRLRHWPDQVKNLDLDVLTDAAAADLLLHVAERRLRDPAADEAQALRLAGLLEGLPLAVHQAAGYINEQTLTLADYIARYEEEAAELLGWFSDLAIQYERPEKLAPRPVLVTWKTSFEKLSADDRFWLLVFSHFAPEPVPRFLLTPAEGATTEWRTLFRQASDAVARAGRYSLITFSTTEPIFKLHRLVQQITRLQAQENERNLAIGVAIALFRLADPGNPFDVRSWPKWSPLQNHASALCAHTPNEAAAENFAWLLSQLGNLYQTKSLLPQAEPLLRRALEIDRATYGDNHPLVAIRLNNLAQLLKVTNRLIEAEQHMRDALRIDRAVYGLDHPDVATDLNNLGSLLQATDRLIEAEPLMRDALRIDRAAYGNDHPSVGRDLNNLAGLLLATQRLTEAEPLMRDALRILHGSLGPEHPNTQLISQNLDRLLAEMACTYGAAPRPPASADEIN
jgi:tetratricopeptide (TPR) repeat protein